MQLHQLPQLTPLERLKGELQAELRAALEDDAPRDLDLLLADFLFYQVPDPDQGGGLFYPEEFDRLWDLFMSSQRTLGPVLRGKERALPNMEKPTAMAEMDEVAFNMRMAIERYLFLAFEEAKGSRVRGIKDLRLEITSDGILISGTSDPGPNPDAGDTSPL